MAAVGFNPILMLLLIILFTTTMLMAKHQLRNQVLCDDAVSVHKVEGLLDENVGAESKAQGRKLLGRIEEKKQKLVDINGEISKRRSSSYDHKGKRNEDSGFVSLNSDYHPPRHHPPKNN